MTEHAFPDPGPWRGEKIRCSANWPSPSSPRWLRSWKRWRTRSPRRCPLPPRTVPGCGWSRPGGYASGCASCHRLRVSLAHAGEAISQPRAGADEAVRRAAADAAVSAAETRIADTGRQAREAIDRARADAEALVCAAEADRDQAREQAAHAPTTRLDMTPPSWSRASIAEPLPGGRTPGSISARAHRPDVVREAAVPVMVPQPQRHPYASGRGR